MSRRIAYTCFTVVALCGVPTQSFSPCVVKPFSGVRTTTLCSTPGEEDGGPDWIREAMDSSSEDGVAGTSPPSPPSTPEFSQVERTDMQELIVSLSKETNDDKRRERLAGILDKELSAASAVNTIFDSEPPPFARLFDMCLTAVGEEVQSKAAAAAAAAALEQQQEQVINTTEKDGGEGGDIIERLKSPEELQLWALIDMMVQSKTLVKRFMGSLGSKGEFR